ncbi:SusC/RagA family TonB-linked outer membrane protein [Dinghuibacter silviterrae]|uniref:TonB-linked SusC/RagA family outer membrane protein n=1 Tax=Dinghuibacter silviterrae TaxID=1539049 RepID=A0A4R8DTX8_9BACT|nr:SusC/RagA family TonB-linked outer membrane protein [Dinghuibacter silviterrae]TDX01378.1 TonB-linked SusC/RagA family outer membrane protein [Dinghuibacter silviterrae]
MNNHALKCLLALILLTCSGALWAQDRTVSGNVINQDTHEPLAAATVTIKGTHRTVVTDAKGFFLFNLPASLKKENVTLQFSHVGYNAKELNVNTADVLIVTMEVNNKTMNDVVVVGYGTQKRANVLGSIATIQGKELEDLPAANLSTALMNTIPGVGVSQTSGKPGATTNLTIRGATTFASGGNTSPLYVIDGLVPLLSASGNIDPTGKTSFDNLDPSEIESISFLKDASATIFGARGANGVVIVTTKRGRSGKPVLSYSGSVSMEDASKLPKMIDPYNQALLLNNWVENYKPSSLVPTEVYTQAELDTIQSHNYDWLRNEWKKGYIQKHALNISGGNDRITFFAGGNYYSEDGNLPGVTDNKYGFQIGATAKLFTGLTADFTANVNTAISNRPAPKGTSSSEQADQMNVTVGTLESVPGWVPEYINGTPVYYQPINWHPAALASSGSYNKDNQDANAVNIGLTYQVPVIKGLTVRALYGRNTFNDFSKQYYVPYVLDVFNTDGVHTNKTSGGANIPTSTQNVIYTDQVSGTKTIANGNSLNEFYSKSTNWQASEQIQYANIFGEHSIDVLLGTEQSQLTGDYLQTGMQTQLIPGYDQYFAYSGNQTGWSLAGQSTSTGRVSYFGRLNYAYKDRYLLQAAFRDDASPNFPTYAQWGFFPSVSGGWKISQERWFSDNVHFLNDLKIRLNVGLTGNDATSSFGYVTRYTATGNNYGYLFGNTLANGLQTTQVPNSQITWERALFKDLGFDGSLWNYRFNFAMDFWYKHQYDMLETPTATVPTTFGGTIANENHGILNSWGMELQLNYTQNLSRDWKVFATVNFGISDNRVIQKYYSAGTDTGYKYPIGKREDLGISGYESTGIVRTQDQVNAWYAKHPGWTINGDSLRVGDLNYVDLDGDGKITSNDQTQIAKRSGNIFGMGFNLGAQWRDFRISTNIALGVGGKTLPNKVDIAPPTKDARGLAMWSNSYTAANPNASLPAIYAPFVNQGSTYWLRSATQMYVQNLQMSWAAPSSFVNRYHLPGFRVYLTGFNLWNIINPTPYKDVRSNEITDYPILRTWTFGVNMTL